MPPDSRDGHRLRAIVPARAYREYDIAGGRTLLLLTVIGRGVRIKLCGQFKADVHGTGDAFEPDQIKLLRLDQPIGQLNPVLRRALLLRENLPVQPALRVNPSALAITGCGEESIVTQSVSQRSDVKLRISLVA